jgi:alkylhydroperoxidase family enzyme
VEGAFLDWAWQTYDFSSHFSSSSRQSSSSSVVPLGGLPLYFFSVVPFLHDIQLVKHSKTPMVKKKVSSISQLPQRPLHCRTPNPESDKSSSTSNMEAMQCPSHLYCTPFPTSYNNLPTPKSQSQNKTKHHKTKQNKNHMRLPYAPSTPPEGSSQETQAIYSRIAARRTPRPLIPLDLALLHNPTIADGYNSLLSALRTHTSLPQSLSELAICYIAVLNTATYEWTAHAPLALKAGVSRTALEAVLRGDVEGEVLSEEEKAVLAFTGESTKGVRVKEGTFERVKGVLGGDKEVLELTMVVAGYNMVSRFLVALDVTESNGKEMVMPAET